MFDCGNVAKASAWLACCNAQTTIENLVACLIILGMLYSLKCLFIEEKRFYGNRGGKEATDTFLSSI